MTPEDIINSAFNSGGRVQGEGLSVLEGNPAKNIFRILPADKAFIDNIICFTWEANTGFQYMGIYTTEQEARRTIELVRERFRDEQGNRMV
jgi:hypothetical protein